jgi:hypothetical protein
MSQFRLAHLGLIVAALGLNIAPAMIGLGPLAHASGQEQPATVRPEIGKPLQAAQDLIKAQKFKDALAKIHEADAVGGKTPFETFTIDRMRAVAASGAGDNETAIKSFEAVIASGRLPASDQVKFVQAVAGLYYRLKDYPKTITWLTRYIKEGGDDPKMRALLTQTYYLNGDYARAAQEVRAELNADEKAGRTPPEEQLQLLANLAAKQNDKAGYTNALEKLVAHYPKKDYWNDLLTRVQSKPGYSDRLSLDLYRLKLASGQMRSAAEYMEMTQLALQAGFPAEAKKVTDKGFESGALGTGAEAERHKRLRELAIRTAADDLRTMTLGESDAMNSKEGTALVNLGYAYVTAGQNEKGINLMEQGIRKGGIKRMEDAKLHMGIAYLQAEQKAKAVQMFKTVQGTDGTADLARFWVIQVNHPIN